MITGFGVKTAMPSAPWLSAQQRVGRPGQKRHGGKLDRQLAGGPSEHKRLNPNSRPDGPRELAHPGGVDGAEQRGIDDEASERIDESHAHEFYDESGGRGLAFPGGEEVPDYWDFVYFALVVGMTSQVSDVGVTSKEIRRTVAVHGVVSFFFNVALLALMVNIAASAI